MSDFEFAFLVVVGVSITFNALWFVAVRIEDAAQRGERIYNARHRDHASVPAMRCKDDA